jgi:hypothetical protein
MGRSKGFEDSPQEFSLQPLPQPKSKNSCSFAYYV